MSTLIRTRYQSCIILGLLLPALNGRGQPATAVPATLPEALPSSYTSNTYLSLTWTPVDIASTQVHTDTIAVAAPVLLDLRIGRPKPYAVGVALYWTSQGECPTTQFAVERRDEGQSDYRRVVLLPGQGAVPGPHSYCFIDDGNADTRPCSYRLRQICTTSHLNQVSAAQLVPGAVPGPPEPKNDGTIPAADLAAE